MARFEVPEGWCVQAFRFTLDPTEDQARALARRFGARYWYQDCRPNRRGVLRKRWNTVAGVSRRDRGGGGRKCSKNYAGIGAVITAELAELPIR